MTLKAIRISGQVSVPLHEIEWHAVRARGPGGQNVNKVATAVHLRFDVPNSSLPDFYKSRLLAAPDPHMTREGVLVIKVQQYRSQEQNRELALRRLVEIIRQAGVVKKRRIATKPSKAARNRRMDSKTRRGRTKSLRGRVRDV